MKSFRTSLFSAAISATLLASAPAVLADDDPISKAIKARQAGFQLYSYYAGPMFGMAKGDLEYDAEFAQTLADNLKTVTHLNNGMMWPVGSDNEARKGKTRAMKNIWEEGSDVGDKSGALKTATTELAAVAGDGLDALRGKIGAVGEACKACHDEYRAEDF